MIGVAAVVVVAAAAVAVVALIGRSADHVVASPRGEPATASTLPPTTTTTRDPVHGSGQAVTFAFGGDVHFEGVLRTKLAANPGTVLQSIAPVLSSADIAMVNLESAITEQNTPIPKEFNFRAPPTAIDAIKAAGVDLITEANNHSLDFGPQGLADTLAAKAATQFPVLGIGANATEAYAPFRTEVKGQRIAIFAATDVMGEEYVKSWTATDTQAGVASTKYDAQARMVAAIQAARPEVDTVVVFLHWGVERMGCPSPRQEQLARALVDAGADIVVGSHAHWLQGAGRLGNAFVDFGLGNFAFYNESGEYGRTGVLTVTATGRTIDGYSWAPARIHGGTPEPLPAGASADTEVVHWNQLRSCTNLMP
jgi:poly-gamma-glutamate capsule biosynthesis protein CapA/YwtB (metallophosphatase superfamily)